jgi:hypothetical protein
LKYITKSGNDHIEFIFLINDLIRIVVGVKHRGKSKEVEDSVRAKLSEVSKEFELMFGEDLKKRRNVLSKYIEEFEPRCDSILIEKK